MMAIDRRPGIQELQKRIGVTSSTPTVASLSVFGIFKIFEKSGGGTEEIKTNEFISILHPSWLRVDEVKRKKLFRLITGANG